MTAVVVGLVEEVHKAVQLMEVLELLDKVMLVVVMVDMPAARTPAGVVAVLELLEVPLQAIVAQAQAVLAYQLILSIPV
jgi:hypothetical protein